MKAANSKQVAGSNPASSIAATEYKSLDSGSNPTGLEPSGNEKERGACGDAGSPWHSESCRGFNATVYPPISTERRASMKLLFTRNDVHKGCLKTTWDAEDRKISWITLFLTDFYHGAQGDLSEYEVTRTVFDEFSKACVKEQSKIYACLEFPFENDYKTCVDELRTSGKVFLTGRDIAARKGKLWGLIKSGAKSRSILVSEAKWQNISHWYRSYEDWTMTCYKFLISDTPLSDWVQDLLTIRNRGLDVEFLARVDKILVNHFEHGIEVVGLDLSPDPFEDVARILSRKLNLSLDIQDSPKNRSH